jgi:hypothetical protein
MIHATNRGFPVLFKEPFKRRNYGNGFPSFTVLQVIDETPKVLRQSLNATAR